MCPLSEVIGVVLCWKVCPLSCRVKVLLYILAYEIALRGHEFHHFKLTNNSTMFQHLYIAVLWVGGRGGGVL